MAAHRGKRFPKNMHMTGSELVSKLKELDIPRKGFAAFLDITERAIQQWISGTRKIPRYVVIILAKEDYHTFAFNARQRDKVRKLSYTQAGAPGDARTE
jgi:hypothetical protein